MSSLRPEELHVAQQIRRDKLRIHNSSNSQHQHLHEFPNMLDEAALYSSQMVTLERHQELDAAAEMSTPHHYGSFPHSSTGIHSSPREQCGNWRNGSSSSGPHQSCDWNMVNYATTSVANQSNILGFELNNNVSTHQHYEKPNCSIVHTDVVQCSTPSLYQNALQDIFKSASSSISTGHGIWGGINDASEHVLNGNQANLWTDRTLVDNNTLRWNSFTDKKINEQDTVHVLSDSNPQGLSLSLSSNSHSNNPSASHVENPQCSKFVKSLQDPMGIASNSAYRNIGPLGPFTGYATILKSSRFLKPCQQLLDQCCCASTSGGAVNVDESGVASKRSNSGVSSSTMFYNSNGNSADDGASNSFSSRPECQKNKAKLLCMQEEVTRRCKQYNQQMQMVVSSFESVAGLSSATPYISLALKSVSRQFRCLKNAISDQLKLVCEVLGDDLSRPTSSTTSNKFDTNMARLRCMDQSIQKNKSSRGNMEFLEPQQHEWRPQRGLPERAVAILKAWLFEHFLHPYPTDTDKHMLATQTGLSRNQVSNWFINARVRVWKPMVEEIHMLETKTTTTGANQNSSKNDGTCCASEGSSSQPRVVSNFEEKGSDIEEQWNQEKRSKVECEITSSMDGTLMGFMPYQRGGGGLGSVSLTLGLRHGVEGVQHQQQQQFQQQQLRRHFGGHMIHDFVG